MIRTFGLTHTALPVADLDRSLRFYQALLGAEVRTRNDDYADITTPGCNDVLTLRRTTDGKTGEMGLLGHIGFRLQQREELATLAQAVVDAGGIVQDTGYFTPDEPYVFATDPDGYTVELWYEP